MLLLRSIKKYSSRKKWINKEICNQGKIKETKKYRIQNLRLNVFALISKKKCMCDERPRAKCAIKIVEGLKEKERERRADKKTDSATNRVKGKTSNRDREKRRKID